MSNTQELIAKAQRILDGRKYWNDYCGWDVSAIDAQRVLDMLAAELKKADVKS